MDRNHREDLVRTPAIHPNLPERDRAPYSSFRTPQPTPSAYSSMPAASRIRSLSPERSKIPTMEEDKMRTIMQQMDEESVVLLRQQLETVRNIKADSERKDAIIADLRQQCSEMRKFRDTSYNLRAELSVVEERAKLRDADQARHAESLTARIRQLEQAERDLRKTLTQQEAQARDSTRDHLIQRGDLEAQMQALQVDAERREQTCRRLENELKAAVRNTQTQQQMAQEQQNAAQTSTTRLQEQLAQVALQKRDAEDTAHRLQDQLSSMKRVMADRDDTVSHLQRECASLEQARLEQASKIGSLQGQISGLQSQLQAVTAEADLVPELRKQLGVVATLRADLQNMREELTDTRRHLDRERQERGEAEAQRDRMQHLQQDTERRLADLRARYAGVQSPSSELAEKRRQVDLMTQEMQRYRETLQTLESQVGQLKQREVKATAESSQVATETSRSINILQGALDAGLRGELPSPSFDPSRLGSAIPNDALVVVFQGIAARVQDILAQLAELRDREADQRARLSLNEAESQSKDAAYARSQKDLHESRKEHLDAQMRCRALEDERQQLVAQVTDCRQTIASLEDDLNSRMGFAQTVLRQLSEADREVPARDDDDDDDDDASSVSSVTDAEPDHLEPLPSTQTSPQRSGLLASAARGSPARSPLRAPAEWPAIQGMLATRANEIVVERDQLRADLQCTRGELARTKTTLEEREALFFQTQDEHRHTTDTLVQEHNTELDRVTTAHREETQKLLHDHHFSIKELEDQLTQAKNENWKLGFDARKLTLSNDVLTKDLEQSRETSQQYFAAARLLSRVLRPYRMRSNELILQKNFLQSQVSSLERAHKAILELMRSMCGELQLSSVMDIGAPPSPRASFRAAVIAVIAHNRLLRFAREAKHYGRAHTAGRQRVWLAPVEVMSADPDIPRVRAETPSEEAETAFRLMAHFDPQSVLEDTSIQQLQARPLFSALAKGIRQFIEPPVHATRRACQAITQRLREVERERNALQRQCGALESGLNSDRTKLVSVEDSLAKNKELVAFLERRVQELQQDSIRMVPPEKYEALRRDHEDVGRRCQLFNEERSRIRDELDAQLSRLAELRAELSLTQTALAERSEQLDRAQREVRDKTEELAALREFVSQKSTEVSQLQDEQRRQRDDIMQSRTSEESLRERLRLADTELEQSKQRISSLELSLLEAERQRQDDIANYRAVQDDLSRKEHDLCATRELLNAIQEAHSLAKDQCGELDRQLHMSRTQALSLKKELQSTQDRAEFQRREHNRWTQDRLKTLTVRADGEVRLSDALETTAAMSPTRPRPASSYEPLAHVSQQHPISPMYNAHSVTATPGFGKGTTGTGATSSSGAGTGLGLTSSALRSGLKESTAASRYLASTTPAVPPSPSAAPLSTASSYLSTSSASTHAHAHTHTHRPYTASSALDLPSSMGAGTGAGASAPTSTRPHRHHRHHKHRHHHDRDDEERGEGNGEEEEDDGHRSGRRKHHRHRSSSMHRSASRHRHHSRHHRSKRARSEEPEEAKREEAAAQGTQAQAQAQASSPPAEAAAPMAVEPREEKPAVPASTPPGPVSSPAVMRSPLAKPVRSTTFREKNALEVLGAGDDLKREHDFDIGLDFDLPAPPPIGGIFSTPFGSSSGVTRPATSLSSLSDFHTRRM
eukprot:gnl/Trimastix_PCT/1923.p1 GENE.gnl/Trimastix_PCT/1923~~gnl/Trimastix_PCT/1923.p1  ORF type:complete len:1662 (+),score=671.49 gnl/Trimastix_PCT/1923:61-5046(+)